MTPKLKIAPSILAADFTRLGEEILKVENAGCDLLHVDVMDGSFVPNISIGPGVIKAIRRISKLRLCAHLMIVEPWKHLGAFRDAGSDEIVVHIEACGDKAPRVLEDIRKRGASPGISLNPGTPAQALESVLDFADLILVMTVNPGFGGQTFMPGVLPKIRELRTRFSKDIAVDGGINPATARLAIREGANVLIAGTSIFSNSDVQQAMELLRS